MRRDRVQIVFSRARELNGPIHVFGPLRSFPRAIVIIIIITVTITVIVIAIILIIVIIIIIIIIAIAIILIIVIIIIIIIIISGPGRLSFAPDARLFLSIPAPLLFPSPLFPPFFFSFPPSSPPPPPPLYSLLQQFAFASACGTCVHPRSETSE
jgi:hypothetical protein